MTEMVKPWRIAPRNRVLLLALFLGLLSPCLPAQAQQGEKLDYAALAKRMVGQMALRPGEHVLTIAHPGKLDKLWTFVRYEVVKAGGIDLGVITVPHRQIQIQDGWDPAVTNASNIAAAEIYGKWFAKAEVIISADKYGLVAPTGNTRPAAARSATNIAMHRWLIDAQEKEGPVKARRTLHFHWWEGGGADSLPGVQAPPDYAVELVLQKAILEVDYPAIAAIEKRFETATRGKPIRVTSPIGTDISFYVGDRGFSLQDGDLSAGKALRATVEVDRAQELPNGIARVAPIEESVNGVIAYPPTQWAGKQVTGLKLRFRKGRIVSVTADTGLDAVEQELKDAGDVARQFRDFSLGFNPALAVPDSNPWLPYYGFGAGVVRLGLGDNSELSGKVRGAYTRRDLFIDATVTVGPELWVKDGKMVAQ